MIKSEAIDQVMSAFVKAQGEMGNASKSSANPFFKSRYADLNSIREAIMPALSNHKLGIAQPTVIVDGKSYIQTMIVHESGQFFGGLTEIICSKQNDAQNFGAGTTYARRFGLQSLVCVGADDDDGESSMGRGKPSYVPNKASPPKLEVSSSLSKVETTASIPVKAGGFGVKKAAPITAVPVASEEGWD